MPHKVLFYFTTVLLPLVIALMIYILFRSDSTLVNQLFVVVFSTETLDSIRAVNLGKIGIQPFIIYSFPNALWIFSTTILSFNQSIRVMKCAIPLYTFPIIYCLLLELFQMLNFTNGTFDVIDVVASLVFWALAIACMKIVDWQSIRASWMKGMVFFSYAILILSDTI